MTKFISASEKGIFYDVNAITPAVSKARCRVFYKGENRNRTFITETATTAMIKSLPGVPVVGYYAEENNDFVDHDSYPTFPYGFVSQTPNATFEKHVDADGIEREYLTCDVLLWTKRFPEASLIVGNPQSMELDLYSLKGMWQMINGKKIFNIEHASIDALCILGKEVAPCFEGAQFFNLKTKLSSKYQELIDAVQKYNLDKGGKPTMKFIRVPVDFEISHDELRQQLWMLLNPIETVEDEDGTTSECRGWKYYLEDVFDTYCIAREELTGKYFKIPYTKTDSEVSLDLTQMVAVEERYLTEEEAAAIDSAAENFVKLQKDVEIYQETIAQKDNEIVRLEGEINAKMQDAQEGSETQVSVEQYQMLEATLAEEKDKNAQSQITIDDLRKNAELIANELASLKAYKLEQEKLQKLDFIKQYAESVDEAIVTDWQQKAEELSITELKSIVAVYMLENAAPGKKSTTTFVNANVIDNVSDKAPDEIKLLRKVRKL